MKDNKLIAEFMGWSLGHPDPEETRWSDCWFDEDGIRKTRGELEPLRFHASWDWLMPVMEKIETYLWDNAGKVGYFDDCLNSNDIEIRYQAVVEFIKWYNER